MEIEKSLDNRLEGPKDEIILLVQARSGDNLGRVRDRTVNACDAAGLSADLFGVGTRGAALPHVDSLVLAINDTELVNTATFGHGKGTGMDLARGGVHGLGFPVGGVVDANDVFGGGDQKVAIRREVQGGDG